MRWADVRGACAREVRYLHSHAWDWALISWVPVLALALVWGIFSAGVSTKLPLALVDEDHSRSSRELTVALDATRSTTVAAAPPDLRAAWPLVRARRVYAVLHVPHEWERRAIRGDPQPVVLYTNEQFHAAAGSISNDVSGALLAVAGQHAAAAEHDTPAVAAEYRTLFGPQLSFERALAGALLPAILHLFVLGGAAYALGREFRDRTAGDWLGSAGGDIAAAVLGKLLPLLACSLLIALGIGVWNAGYRGWSASGSLLVWYGGLVSLVLACCAIPALLVGLTGSLRAALSLCALCNVTAVSFSGFTYPVYSMAAAAKVWAHLLPFPYFFQVQQQQWNTGAPLGASLMPLSVLWGAFILLPLSGALPRLAARCRDPKGWGAR
jgi:ABC-2 type transport system permease protein